MNSDAETEEGFIERENESNEIKLRAPDGSTINELNWRSESGQVPLPLSDQDREEIDRLASRKARRFRLSTLELMLGISWVCLVLALCRWLPLPLLALGLGCTTTLVMLGFLNPLLNTRNRVAFSSLLFIAYLIVALVALYHS